MNLAQAFHFDAADLQDNQHGFISRKQKRRLIAVMTIATVFAILIIGFLIGFWLAIVRSPDSGWLYRGIMSFLFLGIVAGIIGAGWGQWEQLIRDVRANRVEKLEGTIKRTSYMPRRAKAEYFIMVGEVPLRVNGKQQETFEEAQAYRVYIAPHSRTILSAEIISDTKPKRQIL